MTLKTDQETYKGADSGCQMATDYLNNSLKKLMLIIEKSFQFLYSLGFSAEDEYVLSIWQAKKIDGTVIILNPIKVVNYPAFRQRLAMSLFPNKDMFQYISRSTSSWVVRFQDMDIAISIFESTAFPTGVVSSLPSFEHFGTQITDFPTVPYRTRTTSESFSPVQNFPAINAELWWLFGFQSIGKFNSTTLASNRSIANEFPTIDAMMSLGLQPYSPLPFSLHNYILMYLSVNCKYPLSQIYIQSSCLDCPFSECKLLETELSCLKERKAKRDKEIVERWKQGANPKHLVIDFKVSIKTIERAIYGK